ncbi:lactonizing lipase [Caldimonas brevitalea]|uniref:Lactonizing lipase n=1 Tax=Caldimonas brevitalea TaxID=413882 RepID=A0A0G3C038_9BURK|nr:lactonizing lipase [Caldimonas brevitalea]
MAAAMIAGAQLLASTPAHADDYARTRYPIVLVHGVFGFDSVGIADYWFGIPSALRSGGAQVFVSQESAAHSSEMRGEQLLAELRRLRAAYGHTRFNLIAHSHGGQSVRYVAAVDPGLVASVTTVGTPHQGSPVADLIKRGTDATGSIALVSAIVNGFAKLINVLSGGGSLPQNSEAAMLSLTTEGAASFNARFPAGAPTTACGEGPASVNGVRYYSASGTSTLTNVLDVGDAMLGMAGLVFNGEANDGLVGRCSSRWGQVLRDDYGWNHMDEVNHVFGLRNWFASDPVAFYRSHANRLKNAGL